MKLAKMTLLMAAALCVMAAPALADGKNGRGHDDNRGGKYERNEYSYRGNGYNNNGPRRDVVIVNNYRPANRDRVVIREYLQERPGRRVGHYKRQYVIGQPLPTYVTYQPVPTYVVQQLQPVPYGYQYVQVDSDVLLMSEASHKIIDAITLLSATN